MGYIVEHAIVVTAYSDDIHEAHSAALAAGCNAVTPVVDARINGACAFLIAPDGSKEGWPDSDDGDAARDRFVQWIKTVDRSWRFQWYETEWREENDYPSITRHSASEETA